MSAFFYLVWTSARNRFWFQLRRARSPRYAAALIIGALYIWAFLIRPAGRSGVGPMLLTRPTEMIVTLLMVITLSGAWVFGSDTIALAFTQAEVSMLFPAPLSRRALIGYKLYRAQMAVLINALIWIFVLRRGGTALPSPLRAIGIWVLFSTLNFHRLGAALVRSSWREHGTAGARRNRWSIAFFLAVAAALAAGLIADRQQLAAANDAGEFFAALSDVLSKAPASIGLLPFHLVVAPTFARTIDGWWQTILPAIGILAVHAWWVLRTDTAFEDAAIEASAERVKRLASMRGWRSATAATPKSPTRTIRLATVGHPALAIVWKNMLCLRRTVQWRLFIGPTVMSIALGAAIAGGERDVGAIVATSALMLGAMLILFGGRMIRNDLRHDMLHLPLLKSLPIAPSEIVLAEVASAALPMAALQLTLIIIAFGASLAAAEVPVPLGLRVGILLASPFAVLALNGALLTIQNGIAVMFPAWIRLGSAVNTGVEMLGQNLLATVANLISLALGLVVPGIIALIAVRYLMVSGAAAVAVTILVASAALALETYGVMRMLGRALAKAEPLQS